MDEQPFNLNFDRSSVGGDVRGGVYDVSTNTYSQPARNQTDQNADIEQQGIDEINSSTPPQNFQEEGGGLPEGFEEETLDVVEDDNTAGQRVFLTKEV